MRSQRQRVADGNWTKPDDSLAFGRDVKVAMCKKTGHNHTGKKYRLADFFNQWWDEYTKQPKHYITPEQYKAVNAIRVCRTAALGVDVYACPECGEVTEVYHSCKNRFCPTCSWRDTVKWSEKVKEKMMRIPHRHVIMTLPHQLNGLIKRNEKLLYNILLRTAADTFKDWMLEKYNLKSGIISVLHTFGEAKNYHVHVHMIVSWGGIEKSTHLLKPIKGEFVNYSFLKKKFRKKFEDTLFGLYENGELLHDFKNIISLRRYIKMINQKNWNIHLEPPMDVPEKVVRYIGRYSKRACLSEYKITKMEGRKIGFLYKDYKNKDINGMPIEKEMEMEYTEFFPRLLQHVPLKYFRLVRYYGYYSNRGQILKEYLSTSDTRETETKLPTEEIDENNQEFEDLKICEYCEKEKIYLYTVFKNKNNPETIIYRRDFLNQKELFKKTAA